MNAKKNPRKVKLSEADTEKVAALEALIGADAANELIASLGTSTKAGAIDKALEIGIRLKSEEPTPARPARIPVSRKAVAHLHLSQVQVSAPATIQSRNLVEDLVRLGHQQPAQPMPVSSSIVAHLRALGGADRQQDSAGPLAGFIEKMGIGLRSWGPGWGPKGKR